MVCSCLFRSDCVARASCIIVCANALPLADFEYHHNISCNIMVLHRCLVRRHACCLVVGNGIDCEKRCTELNRQVDCGTTRCVNGSRLQMLDSFNGVTDVLCTRVTLVGYLMCVCRFGRDAGRSFV